MRTATEKLRKNALQREVFNDKLNLFMIGTGFSMLELDADISIGQTEATQLKKLSSQLAQQVRASIKEAGNKLKITMSDEALIPGDFVNFTVEVNKGNDGYLNLIQIDPECKISVLFPNFRDQNNFVTSDVHIPRRVKGQKSYGFKASDVEPVGEYLLFAILSKEELNLGIDVYKKHLFKAISAAEGARLLLVTFDDEQSQSNLSGFTEYSFTKPKQ